MLKVSIFVKFLTSEQQISSFCFANQVVLHSEGDVLDSEIFMQINIQHTCPSEQFFLLLYSVRVSRVSGIQEFSATDRQQRCQPLLNTSLGVKTKQNGAFSQSERKPSLSALKVQFCVLPYNLLSRNNQKRQKIQ